jgi:hypothetical protein
MIGRQFEIFPSQPPNWMVVDPSAAFLVVRSLNEHALRSFLWKNPLRRQQISHGFGEEPKSSADGRTLYYRADELLLAVPLEIGTGHERGCNTGNIGRLAT